MFLSLFDKTRYSGGDFASFNDLHLMDTPKVSELTYTKKWSNIGDFTAVFPYDREILQALKINGFLHCMGEWFWTQSISYDGTKITVKGTDSKGLLGTRLALWYDDDEQEAGTEGYDVVGGNPPRNTAYCIKHYLDNNCIDPSDVSRRLPIVWVGGANGIGNDHYMAKYQYISEIVNELCDGAEIGYEMTADGGAARKFSFKTLAGVDRSFGQNTNPRVIFSLKHRNLVSQSFEHGVDNLYNVIYATTADNVEYIAQRDNPTNGHRYINRRETHVSVSINSTDSDIMQYKYKYAIEQVKDNVETHSYVISPSQTSGFGTEYDLGDTVSIIDDYTGDRYDAKITEYTRSIRQGEDKVTIVLGKQKQKPLEKIVNGFLSGTQRRL